MGELVWEGWQTSAEDAPQPVGVVTWRNLRKVDGEKLASDAPAVDDKPSASTDDAEGGS